MKTIQLSDEAYEFLKDMQHELNTQPNDGNADPLYWGVIEEKEEGVPEGCGDEKIYLGDASTVDLSDAISIIEEHLEDNDKELWETVDKTNIQDVANFCVIVFGWSEARVVYTDTKYRLSKMTGAFLTKRACKEYIERYGYNHTKPHTYAMTAFRNFELEKLLNILKTMKL